MSTPILRANLEWAMIHVGIGNANIFDVDFSSFGHLLPRTWIKSLWQFVHEYGIKMPPYEHIIKHKREHDIFLMEAFHQAGFNKRELTRLNRCRLYLQVETLSDITDGTGDMILATIYNGNRTSFGIAVHDWPVQHKPDKHHWRSWRKAIRCSFPRRTTQRLGTLTRPLGPWTDNNKDKWRWFFSEGTSKLFSREMHTNSWKVYQRVCTRGRVNKKNVFKYARHTNNLPIDAVRATVSIDRDNSNRYRITGWAPENPTPTPTLDEQEEQKMNWMIHTRHNIPEEEWIILQLRERQPIMIVSDGSYHPEFQIGTSAWVITSATNTSRRVYADNLVPGQPHVQCPHRSELCGLIGAVRHIKLLCQQNDITDGQIEIACDGLEAFKIASRFQWNHTTNMGHYDLSSCLHQLLRNSPLQWQFRHVKGHQDKDQAIEDIDIWGQLNMVADAYAKVALWRSLDNDTEQPNMQQLRQAIPALQVTYHNRTTIIVSNLRKRLTHYIAQERMLHYWRESETFGHRHEFDKEVLTHAARNIPIQLQIWLPKWTSGICGVGKWLARWKDQNHSKCPRCLTDNETVDHVIHCQHEDASLTWNSGIEDIKEWMINHNAIPGLAEAVGLRLTQWRNHLPITAMEQYDESVRAIITAQDIAGWEEVRYGALHPIWSQEQGKYLTALGKRTTGTAWMSQFIRKYWQLQHSMWIHRNSFVHKDGKSIHQHEEEAVNRVIREEFIFGRNGLPNEYSGLFRGGVQRLIEANAATKVQWLYRVWSGRDRLRRIQELDPWYKQPLAATFLRRHLTRRKRKRRYDVLDDG